MAEAIFVSGLYPKAKHANAPSFVICKLSAKPRELIAWLQGYENEEWINMDIKLSKSGEKMYVQMDTWKKGGDSGYQEPDRSNWKADNMADSEGTVEIENPDGSVDITYPEADLNPNDIPF